MVIKMADMKPNQYSIFCTDRIVWSISWRPAMSVFLVAAWGGE